MNRKQYLRTEMKARLSGCASFAHREWAKNLFQFLFDHFSTDCILGGYFPLAGEPDWREDDQYEQWKWAFPRPKQEGMEYALSCWQELELRPAFGTKMHIASKDKRVVIPDVLLVPGIAFGKAGERLGRGGGFFDRYIANYSGVLVGVCFELQLSEKIPMQKHDKWMDYVITECNIYQRVHS